MTDVGTEPRPKAPYLTLRAEPHPDRIPAWSARTFDEILTLRGYIVMLTRAAKEKGVPGTHPRVLLAYGAMSALGWLYGDRVPTATTAGPVGPPSRLEEIRTERSIMVELVTLPDADNIECGFGRGVIAGLDWAIGGAGLLPALDPGDWLRVL